MKFFKLTGKSIDSIIQYINKTYGSRAVILSSGRKGERWEVTVGIVEKGEILKGGTERKNLKPSVQTRERIASHEQGINIQEITLSLKSIERAIERVTDIVKLISTRAFEPAEVKLPQRSQEFFRRLVARGVERNIALAIVDDISQSELDFGVEGLAFALSSYLEFYNPLISVLREQERKVIFLVGPTGVGKTTTAAKISALYLLMGRRSVALVTTDNWRVGATEQLLRYAKIMDLPFFTAFSVDEIRDVAEKTSLYDLTVVDTMGKSQYDLENIKKIARLVDAVREFRKVEVGLLVSVSQREDEMINVIRSYSEVKFDFVIFTKVDETSFPGTIINISSFLEKPIAFITKGQSVPDDIVIASAKEVAKIILGVH